jgi:hypothetical protein
MAPPPRGPSRRKPPNVALFLRRPRKLQVRPDAGPRTLRQHAVPFVPAPIAGAQEPGQTYKLGVINGVARQAPRNVAFFDELRGLSFVEGQNLKIIVDGFGLRDEQFAEAAASLCNLCRSHEALRVASPVHEQRGDVDHHCLPLLVFFRRGKAAAERSAESHVLPDLFGDVRLFWALFRRR